MKDRNGKELKEGQRVLVHPYNGPGRKSISRHPFHATIIRKEINWVEGPKVEWCTSVEGGHDAVINEYLRKRIEIIC